MSQFEGVSPRGAASRGRARKTRALASKTPARTIGRRIGRLPGLCRQQPEALGSLSVGSPQSSGCCAGDVPPAPALPDARGSKSGQPHRGVAAPKYRPRLRPYCQHAVLPAAGPPRSTCRGAPGPLREYLPPDGGFSVDGPLRLARPYRRDARAPPCTAPRGLISRAPGAEGLPAGEARLGDLPAGPARPGPPRARPRYVGAQCGRGLRPRDGARRRRRAPAPRAPGGPGGGRGRGAARATEPDPARPQARGGRVLRGGAPLAAVAAAGGRAAPAPGDVLRHAGPDPRRPVRAAGGPRHVERPRPPEAKLARRQDLHATLVRARADGRRRAPRHRAFPRAGPRGARPSARSSPRSRRSRTPRAARTRRRRRWTRFARSPSPTTP